MKMRIIRASCILLVAALLIPAIAIADTPTVVVTGYQINPEVLMPGDIGTIKITITNTAATATQVDTSTYTVGGSGTTTTTTTTVNADIQSIYLFGNGLTVLSGNYRNVGELGPGQSTTITFTIEAPTKDDTYFPKVWIDVLGGRSAKYPIPVKVDSSSVSLTASEMPSVILKDDASQVKLSIANKRPNSINSTVVTPMADGIAFAPTEIFLGAMKPDEQSTATFTLHPTSLGKKDVTFVLTYQNGDNSHSESLTCSIDVIEGSGVKLILAEYPTSVVKGKSARIELDVVNARSSDITSVSVVPIIEGRFTPSEVFIGTMEQDDVFSANFDVDTSDLALGTNDIGFKVTYKDGRGFHESGAYAVSIDIVEVPVELPSTLLLIIFIAVSAVGYYVYRRRR
ncbi:MAG: hypothetical protein IB616_02680 [Methanosarcinales archaeon]|nr:MAG: hypothetical protein IB616_02680 [Methanosarcinales archaeon]